MSFWNFFKHTPKEPERPAQKFEINQDVTPMYSEVWRNQEGGVDDLPTPKFGKIYRVTDYVWMSGKMYTGWGIGLGGLPSQYSECSFAPVITTKELNEALESVPQTVSV